MKTGALRRLRRHAVAIFRAGVKAVEPEAAIRRHVRRRGEWLSAGAKRFDLSRYERVLVVGAGKAAAAMARPLEDILADRLQSGIVNVKYGHAVRLRLVKVNEAGHPVPDRAGLEGTREIIRLLRRTGERDLVFVLISGGGSALLPAPAPGLTLKDKQRTTELLLKSGATIDEMNAVRKHLSAVKGGRLARLAYPATAITLILSDVIGDRLESIASGPTVPDSTTFADCLRILKKYDLADKVPAAVLTHLQKGARGLIDETPKAGDPCFARAHHLIIGSNIHALRAAKLKAESLGYRSLILSSSVDGETREIARMHAAMAREIVATGNPVRQPVCLLSGGETTVSVRGRGLGGRNQEFALAAAAAIDGLTNVVILSGGTDGTDGPTDAAGAIADGTTVSRARALRMDPESYLAANDSYHFFRPLGDLLMTGPTLTNVMDLRVILVD